MLDLKARNVLLAEVRWVVKIQKGPSIDPNYEFPGY